MIRPLFSNIINDHKAPKKLKVHSCNEVIDYETQYGEWKIQLTMSINFISSKDSDETRNIHTKSYGLNNKSIALDILFVPYNTEKIRLAYKSKHSFKRENQVILLMITDGKK